MSTPAIPGGDARLQAAEELTGLQLELLFLQSEAENLDNDLDEVSPDEIQALVELTGGDGDLWFYRDRTAGLLRRYARLSVEVGRVPSLLGREFFRSRVTSYRMATFEDAVIFVHDVEQALETLHPFDKSIVARISLQDYTGDEAAVLLGCARRTIVRRFPEVLDQLSKLFLEGGLLTRLPDPKPMPPESCQEGESDEIELSDCE